MKVSRTEALHLFRRFRQTGSVVTGHFKKRSKERHFDMQDVFAVAKNGRIKRKPRYHPDRDNWTYTIEGKDVEDKPLIIVFCITDEGYINLITGIRP